MCVSLCVVGLLLIVAVSCDGCVLFPVWCVLCGVAVVARCCWMLCVDGRCHVVLGDVASCGVLLCFAVRCILLSGIVWCSVCVVRWLLLIWLRACCLILEVCCWWWCWLLCVACCPLFVGYCVLLLVLVVVFFVCVFVCLFVCCCCVICMCVAKCCVMVGGGYWCLLSGVWLFVCLLGGAAAACLWLV